MIGIGRQGFVGDSGSTVAPHVPVAWIGKWVEAYFADNSDTIKPAPSPDNYPFSYVPTAHANGLVLSRPTVLGANTSESWTIPTWDIVAKQYKPSCPTGSLFSFKGTRVLNPFVGASVPMGYPTVFPLPLQPCRVYNALDTFVVTDADVMTPTYGGTVPMYYMVGIHRGSITNVTTGISLSPVIPSISATATEVPTYQTPALYGVLQVSVGDVVEFAAGTVIENRSGISPIFDLLFEEPINNNGFYQRLLNYPYPTAQAQGVDYRAITDSGSPTSLQGVAWIDAFYPDVPAYKLEFEVMLFYEDCNLQYTYQGGQGITSYATMVRTPTLLKLNGHYNNAQALTIINPPPLKTWVKCSVELYPTDPTDPLYPSGWATRSTINGVQTTADSGSGSPTLLLAASPDISLGAIYFTPNKPCLMRNVRMSYWERL